MLSIVIPSYNPNISEFKKAIESALETISNEIIIVDDSSNSSEVDYYNYLESLKSNDRIKIIFNKKNLGRFNNSYYSLTLAKNKYVKKLDVDDEIIPSEFNKLYTKLSKIKEDYDLIFTKYKFKNKNKNKVSYKKWNLFNGSTIYNTNSIKKINIENGPKHFWGDLFFIFKIAEDDVEIKYFDYTIYNYKKIGSTTPSKLLEKSKDWFLGYEGIDSTYKEKSFLKYTKEKQDIFFELMSLKTGIKYQNKEKYKYYISFNLLPVWVKKIISYFTFKF